MKPFVKVFVNMFVNKVWAFFQTPPLNLWTLPSYWSKPGQYWPIDELWTRWIWGSILDPESDWRPQVRPGPPETCRVHLRPEESTWDLQGLTETWRVHLRPVSACFSFLFQWCGPQHFGSSFGSSSSSVFNWVKVKVKKKQKHTFNVKTNPFTLASYTH